jgi:hypothetical protein
MRCLCTACLLEAALRLLRSGRVSMGVLLLEQALQRERERAEHRRPVQMPAKGARAGPGRDDGVAPRARARTILGS